MHVADFALGTGDTIVAAESIVPPMHFFIVFQHFAKDKEVVAADRYEILSWHDGCLPERFPGIGGFFGLCKVLAHLFKAVEEFNVW
jgi:hypothetical protein